jgi:hypothetical protein
MKENFIKRLRKWFKNRDYSESKVSGEPVNKLPDQQQDQGEDIELVLFRNFLRLKAKRITPNLIFVLILVLTFVIVAMWLFYPQLRGIFELFQK